MTAIDSAVLEVVVFPDRARVTRRGLLTLEAGTHQIEFINLPLTLQPESIRAAGRGTAAASLLGVDTRRVYFSETPTVSVKELEQQIEELNNQDKALADQAAAAEVQVAFVKDLSSKSSEQLARGLAFGRAEMSQGETLIVFVHQQLAAATAALRDIAQKRRDLTKQIAKLNNDLATQQSSRPRERFSATVEVEVKRAGDLTLDLTYLVNQAGWGALYDLRLAAEAGGHAASSVQLSYLGQLTQRTGEDWNEVTLTLSTARPSLTTLQPELKPWYINAYFPPPAAPAPRAQAMLGAAAPMMKSMVVREEQAFAAEPQAEMAAPVATVSSEGASVTFKLPQTASLPSDGTPHKVTIATLDLKPQFDYIAVPKLAEAVYRRAKITNRSEYLLLPGQANLFVGGDFVGTLPIKRVAPDEEFELALGVDDRVTIKRELKARDVDKKLLGDRRRLRVAYEIEITNLLGSKIDLELHDQFPVSQHEQIKVKLEAADPKPAEQSELNELEWRLAFDPNAKQTIRFDFSIEYPTVLQVTGLP